jgi:hypothetical protein
LNKDHQPQGARISAYPSVIAMEHGDCGNLPLLFDYSKLKLQTATTFCILAYVISQDDFAEGLAMTVGVIGQVWAIQAILQSLKSQITDKKLHCFWFAEKQS